MLTLWRIKVLHTVIWFVFAAAILAIPVVTAWGNLQYALWLSILVWCEVLVLVLWNMRCPLTGLAARYTESRADNFDIFLPAWLARENKRIFGSLFAAGELFLLWRWMSV